MKTVVDYETSYVKIEGLFNQCIEISIRKIHILKKRLEEHSEYPFKSILGVSTALDNYNINNFPKNSLDTLLGQLTEIPKVK